MILASKKLSKQKDDDPQKKIDFLIFKGNVYSPRDTELKFQK